MAHRSEKSRPDNHPLDQVIWRALTSVQRNFAHGDQYARRYPAAIAPFAATVDLAPRSFNSLLTLFASPDDRIALFTPAVVEPSSDFSVLRRDSVEQMVPTDAEPHDGPSSSMITMLGAEDVPEMLALAGATQPGPFAPRTSELGQYLGVRRGGALIAMVGERMRLDGFTEISAVCVDAAHRGQGLAIDLVRSLSAAIAARSETPFLHVFSSNRPAIALYRKLGFAQRRQMHLLVLSRVDDRASDRPSQPTET